jgi:hypothetical protein
MAGNLTATEERAFKLMLEFDTIRGSDSTGVYIVPRHLSQHNKPKLVKSVGTPWDLYKAEGWRTALAGQNKVLIGHNRAATRGFVTEENAHPFDFGVVVGAHNGTLQNQTLLDKDREWAVDSQAIFHHMSLHGPKETIEKIHGAFALTWYNTEDNTFNVCRNKERPLVFTFSEDGKTLFWASEAWMLSVALSRCGIKHKELLIFAENVHYCFDLSSTKVEELPKARAVKYAEYVPPPVASYYKGRRGWGGYDYEEDGYWNNYGRRADPVGTPPPFRRTANNNVFALPPPASKKNVAGTAARGLVEFIITQINPRSSVNPMAYIAGHIKGDVGAPIRCYAPENGPDWKMLAHLGAEFSGRVKSESSYCLIDLRTIFPVNKAVRVIRPDELEFEDEKANHPEVYPVGSRGAKTNRKGFAEWTKKGCAICSSPASIEDAGKLVWIFEDTDFICHGCQSTEIGKEYCSISTGVCV